MLDRLPEIAGILSGFVQGNMDAWIRRTDDLFAGSDDERRAKWLALNVKCVNDAIAAAQRIFKVPITNGSLTLDEMLGLIGTVNDRPLNLFPGSLAGQILCSVAAWDAGEASPKLGEITPPVQRVTLMYSPLGFVNKPGLVAKDLNVLFEAPAKTTSRREFFL